MNGNDFYEQSVGDKGINTTNFNRVVRAVRILLNATWSENVHIIDSGTSRCYTVLTPDTSGDNFRFGCSLSGKTVTIRAGTWCTLAGDYTIEGSTVELTGETEYVYTYHKKDHSTSGFNHATTRPTSSGDQWVCVLATYTSTDATTWTLSEINRQGDIMLYGPTA